MNPFRDARERLERALRDPDVPVHDDLCAEGRRIAEALQPSTSARQSERKRADTLQRMLIEARRVQVAPGGQVSAMPAAENGQMHHEVAVPIEDGRVKIRTIEALTDEEARDIAEKAAERARAHVRADQQ